MRYQAASQRETVRGRKKRGFAGVCVKYSVLHVALKVSFLFPRRCLSSLKF